jgi:hypothetical protein
MVDNLSREVDRSVRRSLLSDASAGGRGRRVVRDVVAMVVRRVLREDDSDSCCDVGLQ